MISLDPQQQTARNWFESLRDRICAEFESIEAEAGSEARFTYTPWDREADGLAIGEGGGGVRGVMTGKVFEKVGVNVSTVGASSPPILPRRSTVQAMTPAFSPPASAWSLIWRTRTSPRCI
jgi:coproporphyrinogen III oxidase